MARQRTTTLVDQISPETVQHALTQGLTTRHAIFFHHRGHTLAMATAHAVEANANGTPIVGPGRPMSASDEQHLLDILTHRESVAGIEIFPDTILYQDRDTVVWWLPPKVRAMHLRDFGTGLRTIKTHWPNLVAVVRGRTLHLLACAGTSRPGATTPVFHAPLGNVHADSRVCTGSAKLPLGQRIADLPAWEGVVFDTAFTHVNHEDTLARPRKPGRAGRSRRDSILHADAAFWLTRDGLRDPFPDAMLHPLGGTLGEWLARFAATRANPASARGRA